MNVFVINAGSSSIKYQVIRMPEATVVCSGLVDRVGFDGSGIRHKTYINRREKIIEDTQPIANHATGLKAVAKLLTNPEYGIVQDPKEIDVVGHRVVHGGESFSDTIIINAEVKEKIKGLFSLAPLHNPPNYEGIVTAEQVFPDAVQVAVFDTSFHQTMPPIAFRMAIPNSLYVKDGIRAYGFHGTSHKYVSGQAAHYLGGNVPRMITIHLGNGCSMCAIRDGVCIDTSMGLGPMNGLIMGTRAGDIDQSVIFYLMNQLGYSIAEVNTMLNHKSGMLGLTGFSDMRDVNTQYKKGDEKSILAYSMYAYRIRKFIGAYAAVLNGLDAIVFTAGVGENDPLTRSLATTCMEYLGIRLDEEKNYAGGHGILEINKAEAPVKILVIPTNEELEIARQCYALLTM